MPPDHLSEEAEADAMDPLADPEERRVLCAALDSFRQYRQAAHYNITHVRRQSFYSLPYSQVEILSSPPFSLPQTFDAVDRAIDANADIAEAILEVGLSSFGLDAKDDSWKKEATPSDLDKARSTIRQLYRDWSSEGLPERHAVYAPIFRALQVHLPVPSPAQRHEKQVLVPGAGLGRLVFDLCAAGYSVEGSEISYHQLLASNYILNFVRSSGQHELCPWAFNFSNHLTRSNQLTSVRVPDLHPATTLQHNTQGPENGHPRPGRMSMSAGDFCVSYKQAQHHEAFDAVTTCFFIDTAPNVIHYIETVRHCLKLGGVWVNVGPLLWHFERAPTPAEREKQARKAGNAEQGPQHSHRHEGIGEPGSFELSNDEVLALVGRFGFEVVEQGQAAATGYIQDPASMLQNVYRPSFWVARKAVE